MSTFTRGNRAPMTDTEQVLETRITNAIEHARAEQERWQTRSEDSTNEAERLDATVHLAASAAVLSVLEEILEPGTHSEDDARQDT
jgi:hypothetical protein